MTGCSREPRAFVLAACAALLAVTAGCGAPRNFGVRSEFIPFTPEQTVENEASLTRAYRIQEGDILGVHFAYEKSLNQDGVVVLSDGSINLVGVDRIPVAGLSLAEADSIITLAYSREYREPALSVLMQETVGRRVYVLGEVRNPGFFKVPLGGMDVMSAIGMAAGFTNDAAREATVVVRVTDSGYLVREVDLKTFGTVPFAQVSTMPLEAYDIIYVPRSRSGDFSYFAKNILAGIGNLTRIAYDLRYIMTGQFGGS